MNIQQLFTIYSRTHFSFRSTVPRVILLSPSDALSTTLHRQAIQQHYQSRPIVSVVLIKKLRKYNNGVRCSEATSLRKQTSESFDPWKPIRSERRGEAYGEVDAAGPPYVRHLDDPTDDNIQIDEINRLIYERNHARRDRDFDKANSIRTELKSQHGVVLNDQERTWSTNPANVGRFRPTEDFGPTGHDYKLSEKSGRSISYLHENMIHDLISERLHCKLHRKFERADIIEKQLNDANVQLDDQNKVWRHDGKRFACGVYDYAYADEAGPIKTTMPVEKIKALLRERLACRFNRDFITADRIREELKVEGIYIEDVDRLWRGDGIPFPKRVHNPREGYDEA